MSETGQVIKVFEYALNQEKTGLTFFESAIERLSLGAAVSALEKLIHEEEKHITFINRILEDLNTTGRLDRQTISDGVLTPANFFDERAKTEFLDLCVTGSMIPDVTVFNLAWLIEKDLAEFYAQAAEKAAGPTKEGLEMLAHWEKGHEKFFRDYRDKLTETYARMPWGG